jgi:hypothetical protein
VKIENPASYVSLAKTAATTFFDVMYELGKGVTINKLNVLFFPQWYCTTQHNDLRKNSRVSTVTHQVTRNAGFFTVITDKVRIHDVLHPKVHKSFWLPLTRLENLYKAR